MKRLRKGGGTASLAVHRAEEIIKGLSVKERRMIEDSSRRLKYGDLRIEYCLKYNLGSGYRLICVKQENYIIISYIGSHDDCDRWLENNRGFRSAFNEESQKIIFKKKFKKEIKLSEDELALDTENDNILMKKINEKILRSVFSGLCAK